MPAPTTEVFVDAEDTKVARRFFLICLATSVLGFLNVLNYFRPLNALPEAITRLSFVLIMSLTIFVFVRSLVRLLFCFFFVAFEALHLRYMLPLGWMTHLLILTCAASFALGTHGIISRYSAHSISLYSGGLYYLLFASICLLALASPTKASIAYKFIEQNKETIS